MSPQEWEDRLRDLDRDAECVRRGIDRETWTFRIDGNGYFLHFYLAPGPAAAREYAALKTLQTLKLPAVRPVLLLRGFRFGDRTGDAVVTAEAFGVRCDRLHPADHARARDGIVGLLARLHAANLGHAVLRPSAFLFASPALLLDAAGLVQGGVTAEQLMRFAHAAGESATRADRVRAWRKIIPGGDVPPPDRREPARLRRDLRDEPIERIDVAGWRGRFVAATSRVEWSAASALRASADDWRREWPRLLGAMNAGTLDVLKRDASGDVLAAAVTLGGRSIDVVLKRPREKYWYRKLSSLTRASRARRAWERARAVRVRGVAVEPPLAAFERRRGGVAVESVAVYERVPGPTLEKMDLDALSSAAREMLFRRCGRTLRRLEDTRLAHTDAKSSNWIVFDSPTRGPLPVLIDAYGVRWLNPWLGLFGLHRLLRAMKNHPQYTPADSLAICQGFAPRATPAPDERAADAH